MKIDIEKAKKAPLFKGQVGVNPAPSCKALFLSTLGCYS